MYYEEATEEGVRPEVAFAQAMKETGWLQYGGDMQITQYNFADPQNHFACPLPLKVFS